MGVDLVGVDLEGRYVSDYTAHPGRREQVSMATGISTKLVRIEY